MGARRRLGQGLMRNSLRSTTSRRSIMGAREAVIWDRRGRTRWNLGAHRGRGRGRRVRVQKRGAAGRAGRISWSGHARFLEELQLRESRWRTVLDKGAKLRPWSSVVRARALGAERTRLTAGSSSISSAQSTSNSQCDDTSSRPSTNFDGVCIASENQGVRIANHQSFGKKTGVVLGKRGSACGDKERGREAHLLYSTHLGSDPNFSSPDACSRVISPLSRSTERKCAPPRSEHRKRSG